MEISKKENLLRLGITIPDITAVVDVGTEKTMRYVLEFDTSLHIANCFNQIRRKETTFTTRRVIHLPSQRETETGSSWSCPERHLFPPFHQTPS